MLLAYSFVSGETIAGSSNRSNLNVIQSGPAALFGFRALIFLDTNSSGIEKKKLFVLVCHYYSCTAFCVQPPGSSWNEWNLNSHCCEESIQQVAFSSKRKTNVLSPRLIGPICRLLLRLTTFERLANTQQWISRILCFRKRISFLFVLGRLLSHSWLSCNLPMQAVSPFVLTADSKSGLRNRFPSLKESIRP